MFRTAFLFSLGLFVLATAAHVVVLTFRVEFFTVRVSHFQHNNVCVTLFVSCVCIASVAIAIVILFVSGGAIVTIVAIVVVAASIAASAQAKICCDCSSHARINDPLCLSGRASTVGWICC